MPKEIPNEVIHISKPIDPAHYDATAIIKHLGAQKKFPIAIFDQALNLHGKVSEFKLVLNCEISQRKTQIALNFPRELTRGEMAEACLAREAKPIPPIIVDKRDAPVKQVVKRGGDVDLYQLPFMRALRDGRRSVQHVVDDYARPEERYLQLLVSSYGDQVAQSHSALRVAAPPCGACHCDYEEQNMETPVATVMEHHPAYHIGACYTGPFEVSEFDIIGSYLQEPLRLTPSETWGDDLLIPADAEIVIEGALIPGKRIVEEPFGEAPGYLGPQRFIRCVEYEVRAINYRKGAMYQSVITPEGDKPWMDLAREGAYLRRCREAVPGVHRGVQARPAGEL